MAKTIGDLGLTRALLTAAFGEPRKEFVLNQSRCPHCGFSGEGADLMNSAFKDVANILRTNDVLGHEGVK